MAQSFQPGERVCVREDFPVGHIRTPVYIRGKAGTVLRAFGEFSNPELLAYCLEGPPKTLYQVRFRQADVWPDYAGAPADTIDIDLFEHWLERA